MFAILLFSWVFIVITALGFIKYYISEGENQTTEVKLIGFFTFCCFLTNISINLYVTKLLGV